MLARANSGIAGVQELQNGGTSLAAKDLKEELDLRGRNSECELNSLKGRIQELQEFRSYRMGKLRLLQRNLREELDLPGRYSECELT
jgi:hypothetical protein